MKQRYQIITARVEDFLEKYDGEPFHALLSDPPYGLSFMGKDWDHGVPGEAIWRGIYDLLLPGASLMAFGGTRTFHRLMVAIEDGGFELRDTLSWNYGSGFPKSHDVSKAIDRSAGYFEKRGKGNPVDRNALDYGGATGKAKNGLMVDYGPRQEPATPESRTFEGYGTALKPAWEPIVLAMKTNDDTFAENALKHGVAGLNIDGARITTGEDTGRSCGIHGWQKFTKGFTRSGELVTEGHPRGRWPANVLFSHHPECVEVGERQVKSNGHYPAARGGGGLGTSGHKGQDNLEEGYTDGETVAVWHCVEDCPVRLLEEQSGKLTSGSNNIIRKSAKGYKPNAYGEESRAAGTQMVSYGDTGTAVRFFYTAKTSPFERNVGLPDGVENNHPTVKPIAICKYLATLLLPPKQERPRRLFVPFSGSGSEVIGALLAGWDEVIAVEMESEYVMLADLRTEYWLNMAVRANTTDVDDLLDYTRGVEKAKKERREEIEAGQLTLFGEGI